jgi:tetratricopeptide (TPR) repeat protein
MRKILMSIVVFALLTAFAGCTKGGYDGDKAEWNSNPSINTEGGVAAPHTAAGTTPGAALGDDAAALAVCEALADTFMTAFDNARTLEETGAQFAAYSEYGRALAAVSAMRLCADELLAANGEAAPATERLSDWDEIGGLNFAEWSVWMFQGIAFQVKGDADAAKTCFANAAINPEFSAESAEALFQIAVLEVSELKTLSQSLAEREDKIYAVWEPKAILFPRGEYCHDDKYLIANGLEATEAEDFSAALAAFEAAIRVNPANADAFSAAATVYLYMEDVDAAGYYIDEGLFADPNHAGLLKLLDAYNEGAE